MTEVKSESAGIKWGRIDKWIFENLQKTSRIFELRETSRIFELRETSRIFELRETSRIFETLHFKKIKVSGLRLTRWNFGAIPRMSEHPTRILKPLVRILKCPGRAALADSYPIRNSEERCPLSAGEAGRAPSEWWCWGTAARGTRCGSTSTGLWNGRWPSVGISNAYPLAFEQP